MVFLSTGAVFALPALFGLAGMVSTQELTSISAISSFLSETTVRSAPVRISGILEHYDHNRDRESILVQDQDGKRMSFSYKRRPVCFEVGDRVVVTGQASVNDNLERYLSARTVTVVGKGKPDPPLVLPLRALDEDLHDQYLIETTGTVVKVCDDELDHEYVQLTLTDDGITLPIAVFKTEAAKLPENLVDARVCARLIYNRTVSGERKFSGPIGSLLGLTIVRPAPASPFDAPPLNLAFYQSPRRLTALGRRTVAGQVLATWGQSHLMLRADTGHVLIVNCADNEPLPPCGSRATVAGYPDTDRIHMILNLAHCRTDDRPALEDEPPVAVSAEKIFRPQHGQTFVNPRLHGKLITLTGILRSVPSADDPTSRAFVEVDGFSMPVDFSSVPDALSSEQIGAKVRLTGRGLLETESPGLTAVFPRIKVLVLILRSQEDVVMLAPPAWWSVRLLAAVIAVLLAALVGLFVRNRIQRRLGRLKVAERTRLAVDLHDSLSQALTGLACQIAAANDALGDIPGLAREKIGTAVRMLDSCRTELRNCLFDLRSDTLNETDFNRAVARTIEQLTPYASISVRFNVRLSRFGDSTVHVVLAIVRELVSNAIRHGTADSVRIAGTYDKGLLLFSVTDDGEGFDPDRCEGFKEGHFGLNGIRERLKTLGGEIRIRSAKGSGTKICISIPVKAK